MSAADLPPGRPGTFRFEDRTLAYETYGDGDRTLVFLHGLLVDAHLNRGLAQALAARGHRVVLLDLLGHGRSDKPAHAAEYRMDVYARQALALLDHLHTEQAVLGGISLGANVSLLAAAAEPERVRGLVIELPVLERAVPAAALTFVPLLLAVRFTGPIGRAATSIVRRLPRPGWGAVDSVLNAASLPPRVAASILHGVLVGPVAPTAEERRAIPVPALVLAHRWDLIHPFEDAANLVAQLADARLVRARWPFELRMRPQHLAGEIATFLDDVWATGGAVHAA